MAYKPRALKAGPALGSAWTAVQAGAVQSKAASMPASKAWPIVALDSVPKG